MKDAETAGLQGTLSSKSTRWADLGVRTLTAAFLVPIVLLDVWKGGVWFELFAVFLGVLIAHEWTVIAHGRSSSQFALHAAGALAAGLLHREIGIPAVLAIVATLTALSIALASVADRPRSFWTDCGIPYVTLPVLGLVLLRQDATWGVHAIMWLLLVVWATDSFAYFAGRIIGGPKLAPRFSPKKTWAGLVGGMVGAGVVSLLYGWFFAPHPMWLAALGAGLAVVAQAGDIFESAFKRHYGVKDSGKLIPGHGGVMDRVDGLVFAVVVASGFGLFLGGGSNAARFLLSW